MDYQALEPRRLLATLTVDTLSDVVDLNDGLVSLREAITATNTNTDFGDASSGDQSGDIIRFDASIAGGTIELNGSQLEITDDLVFRGRGVTIDAGGSSRIFSIDTSEDVLIGNASFVNGVGSSGGAIEHLGAGALQISNARFENNRSTSHGGAIAASQGPLRIGQTSFENNRALDSSGGAIDISSGLLSLFRTTFQSNSAAARGGAVSASDSNLFSNESDFFNNRSGSDGGAVALTGSNSLAVFTSNTVRDNRTTRSDNNGGGGFFLSGDAGSFVFSSTFERNSSFESGGAIQSRDALVVRDSNIVDNFSSAGGGIASRGDLRLSNTVISGNRANTDGGGIVVTDSDAVIVDSTISGNRTRSLSSLLLGGGGGGINFNQSDGNGRRLVIRNSDLTDNVSAESGGAVVTNSSNTTIVDSTIENNTARGLSGPFVHGGGVYAIGGELNVLRTTIAGNRVLDGQAVVEEGVALETTAFGGGISFSGARLNVSESQIVSNASVGNGGGLSLFTGETTLFNSQIGSVSQGGNVAGSTANSDDEFFGNGGGIYVFADTFSTPSLAIIGGAVSNNTALRSGGGLFTTNDGFRIFVGPNSAGESTQFVQNRALRLDGGGSFLQGVGSAVFRDAVFENNTARRGSAIATERSPAALELTLANVTNRDNASRIDDGGFFIAEEVVLTEISDQETSATFEELDHAIGELEDLLTFV